MSELITNIVAGPGGVMTDEVGVVTGELTLATEPAGDGTVRLRVQYLGAEEWYTVTGATVPVTDPAQALHALAVGLLNRPEG
ncbi:hypothetical protein Cme02nite_26490 [Catellatospora methionotrophica]|uniref:Uncharacterized protein n=1 Tax=Catellatospora methionotrophica TaxID=121620 RepID=A0A8J3L8L6_9ACTN|nr:hypothetical protein [Catellatospora methionotrophica]GIG14317.1 hypothetical protein Cme02nite_26490 [Catellatospora methionotrophica]